MHETQWSRRDLIVFRPKRMKGENIKGDQLQRRPVAEIGRKGLGNGWIGSPKQCGGSEEGKMEGRKEGRK